MQKIKIYISTCPNDIFIFGNLITKKVVDSHFSFSFNFHDIEELNKIALSKPTRTIVKTSFPIYFQLKSYFTLLNCGCALGYKCGPVFVSNSIDYNEDRIDIAIPGFHTTAFLLAQYYLRHYKKKANFHELIFYEIPQRIKQKHFHAGVLIHEGRFLYESWGLRKIVDLGEFWEDQTQLPIPLGGILISKDLLLYQSLIEMIIRKSLEYACSNYSYLLPLIKEFSKEKDENIIRKHIETFVNHFTFDLGEEGKKAIMELERIYKSIFMKHSE